MNISHAWFLLDMGASIPSYPRIRDWIWIESASPVPTSFAGTSEYRARQLAKCRLEMQSKSRTQVTAGFWEVSGLREIGSWVSHVTSSLQGAPFSKNCTMVSLFKSGLRGLVSKVSGTIMSGIRRRGLLTYSDHSQGNLRPPECSPPLACLESTNLATYSSMPEQNGKQIRGWKVRKARKAFQAIPALPLRVFRQGHRTSARDCEELKFWSHSNHLEVRVEVTWKVKNIFFTWLSSSFWRCQKREKLEHKSSAEEKQLPRVGQTEKATIQTLGAISTA